MSVSSRASWIVSRVSMLRFDSSEQPSPDIFFHCVEMVVIG